MKFFKIIFFVLSAFILLNACKKEFSFEHNLQSSNQWQFSNGNTKYSGNINSVSHTTFGSTNQLTISGKTINGLESFELRLYGDSLKTGTYNASSFQSSFSYSSPTKTIYSANQLIGEFTVNVTSLESNFIQGNFSGTAQDSTGNLIQISNGTFKSSY